MQEMFQSFIEVDNIFWGDDVFRWWFYIAISIILVFEKKRSTRITFAWYSIVFLIGMFNPLSNTIMSIIAPEWQYRARLYSMLPIPYVLALGSILFIDKIYGLNEGKLTESQKGDRKCTTIAKMVVVSGLCILIILGGTDVYTQDWMRPAQNLEKVPLATLEIKNVLKDQKDITIAVPGSLSSYIRQVAPELYTAYGRNLTALGTIVSQENPDPLKVMEMAGRDGCNFIVITNNNTNIENFKNFGYEPYDQVTGYLIYEVKGVQLTRHIHNEKRQLIKLIYLDENNHPRLQNERYASIIFEYDNAGNCSKEAYLDAEGNRVLLKEGYSAVVRTYTNFSRQIKSVIYMDVNDKPVLINGRYETRREYNSSRMLKAEYYYDQNGELMNRTDTFYASRRIIYDSEGRMIGEEYYDKNGTMTINSEGFSF